MKPLITAIAIGIAVAFMTSAAAATHQASVCGRLLEYVAAPSDDLAHGYAHVRLATSSGDTGVLFHHTNATNTPSRIEPGATRQGANVCISGPYVHVVGSSPYVSPYDLRLASAAALPGTSTAPSEDRLPSSVVAVATALAVVTLSALRRRRAVLGSPTTR